MEFFWKLAGADPYILKDSGEQSQKRFLLIGWLYIFVNVIIFLSFFGLFLGVFDRFLIGVLGAFLMTFVIGNIYRLTLISLEPQTLPVKEQKGSITASKIVRYTVVCLFAIFVSKCLETTFFGFLVDGEVADRMRLLNPGGMDRFIYEESSLFLEHMIMLNKHQQWVWFITIFVVMFFIAPVLLRSALRKRKEYYSIKRIIDKAIVEDFYKKTNIYLQTIYGNFYRLYDDKTKTFKGHREKYLDPPYNTKKKAEQRKYAGSMSDFANLDW